jgi:rhodanese-related sulfurtransferase
MFDRLCPADFVRRRADGELWQLVDVREPWEIEIANVDPSHCIPMGEIPARLPELDPSIPVAVLCHSGGRSARVADYLARQGFVRVANIEGGIDAWSRDCDPAIPRY